MQKIKIFALMLIFILAIFLAVAAENYESILFEVNLRADHLEVDTAYHSLALNVLSQYCDREEIKLMTPDEAKKYRLEVESGRDDASSKKEEINTQIEAIRSEIDEICRTFEETKNT